MFELPVLLANPYLNTLGITPAIATRPATALSIAIGTILLNGADGPAWLLNQWTILFLLPIVWVEWRSGKDGAFFEVVETFMPFLKVIVAIMVSLALLDVRTETMMTSLLSEEIVATPWWHSVGDLAWSCLMGALAWFAAFYRNTFYFFLTELDEDNDLGLLSLYSWMEVFFTGSSALLALFVPVLAIASFIATAFVLWLVRRTLTQREELKRIACSSGCGTSIYPSALSCPTCHTKNDTPMRVGLLGQTTTNYSENRQKQQWELLAQKRCPRCATRFQGRDMQHVCEACGTGVLTSPKQVQAYVEAFDRKLPQVLLFCFVAGLVPFAGLIAGVVYSRLALVSPMRRFVPAAHGCLGRWFMRLVNFVMVIFQPIPGLGAVIMPLMCLLNYRLYRGMLVREQFRPKESKSAQAVPAR